MEIDSLRHQLIEKINQIEDEEVLKALQKLLEVRHHAELSASDMGLPTHPTQGKKSAESLFEETEEEQAEREISSWLKDI